MPIYLFVSLLIKDLTKEYILFKLGRITKGDIIKIVDAGIMSDTMPNTDLIDISLSMDCDDYEFSSRLSPLIKMDAIIPDTVCAAIIENVTDPKSINIVVLLHGLSYFVYQLDFYNTPNRISDLYHNLDYLFHDSFPEYATLDDVYKYLEEWLHETQANQSVKSSP